MTVPKLGVLTQVNVRDAWAHEAHSFTPWLAENLDHLAEAIGIPLELEGQEVAVETFSADILARNLSDDSLVLIENQLEGADHRHLGQLMTYLAGLNAQAVVWVATQFREAHLSAVNWLNEHTVDPFSFFAVQVKAVRIGDSPIAPVFEVLSKPNEWERQLHAVAQESRPMSRIGQERKDFWALYVERFPDEKERGPATAHNARWRFFNNAGLVITLYRTKRSVGVFIRPSTGTTFEDMYETLAPHADRLAELTGATIEDRDGNALFLKYFRADTSDRSTWPELMEFIHTNANIYEAAVKDIFKEYF